MDDMDADDMDTDDMDTDDTEAIYPVWTIKVG